MLEFHERRKLKRFLYSKPMLFFLCILIVFLAKGVWGAYQIQRKTDLVLTKQSQDLAALQEREAQLEMTVDRLTTQRGIEEEIRSTFEVGREGERAIVIVDPSDDQTAQPVKKRGGIWGWFTGLFSGE
jgi:cell division protein FtsB